jgi:hypothetical protein
MVDMLEYDLKGDLHGEGSIIFNESRDDVQGLSQRDRHEPACGAQH